MGPLTILIIGVISAFIGFAIGRLGDKYGGHLNTLHHWVHGLVLIIIGVVYINKWIGMLCFSFGIGHFISDFDDFMNMRVWCADKPHKWNFWSTK